MSDIFDMKSYELGPLAAIREGLLGTWKLEHLAMAQRFLFGYHTDIPSEFVKFGADLIRRGLFRLPFQFTIMEFLCGKGPDQPNIERLVLLAEQIENLGGWKFNKAGDDDIPPIVVLIWPIIRGRDGVWTPRTYENPEPLMIGTGRPAPNDNAQYRFPLGWADRHGWGSIAKAAASLCPAATAMMMSRSATINKIEVPAKLQTARSRSGKAPLFQFHTVKVPAPARRQRTGIDGMPRQSPMLHWRRGHYRRIGAERIVPVAPCLVGVEERGVIAKVYDGIRAN